MKDNYLFLKEVKNLVEKTNCELKVCFQYMNRGDRWIQVRGEGGGARRGSLNTLVLSCPHLCGSFCLLKSTETRESKCGFQQQATLKPSLCIHGESTGSWGAFCGGYKEKAQSVTKTQNIGSLKELYLGYGYLCF
jgi:hypothetical protein